MKNSSVDKEYPYPIYNFCEIPSGSVRDLPEDEQKAFNDHLFAWRHTCPVHPTDTTQDYFYIWDYLNWKAGHPTDD